jgi:hypothetical protein
MQIDRDVPKCANLCPAKFPTVNDPSPGSEITDFGAFRGEGHQVKRCPQAITWSECVATVLAAKALARSHLFVPYEQIKYPNRIRHSCQTGLAKIVVFG